MSAFGVRCYDLKIGMISEVSKHHKKSAYWSYCRAPELGVDILVIEHPQRAEPHDESGIDHHSVVFPPSIIKIAAEHVAGRGAE